MGSLAVVVRCIEQLNEWVGRVASWLVLLVVLNAFSVAVLRYGFSRGWIWFQESYVWMHAIVFLTCSGYTMLHEGHVRIDVIYGSVSTRTKAWINLFGTVFFLLPMLAAITLASFPYVQLSWERLEGSQQAGGLPGVFLLKSFILAFVLLVGLQGVALALRSVMVLAGHPEWDPRAANDEAAS